MIFAIAFSFFKLLMTFPVLIDGGSMLPTFSEGDVVYMSAYEAKFEGVGRGDIVVFEMGGGGADGVSGGEANVLDSGPDESYLYVKRVIGIPGDKIVLREDGIELNGKMLSEPYARGRTEVRSFENPVISADASGVVYNVPAGKYFVLGDNREGSVDSRDFVGTYVEGAGILGKFTYLKFP